jgi:hypothetical protein
MMQMQHRICGGVPSGYGSMPKRKERQVKLHALKKEARYLIALLDNHWLLLIRKHTKETVVA